MPLPGNQLAKIIVAGAQIVGRAFAKAVRAEITASQAAAAARQQKQGANQSSASDAITGMSLGEAKQILNVEDIKDIETVDKNYEHLFNVNSKAKGGSFYLQSKVVRAKERIDQEISNMNTEQNAESQEQRPQS